MKQHLSHWLRLEDRVTPTATPTDAVLRWHDVMLDACKVDNSLNYSPDQAGPTRAARAMAIVQAAVYDAVNSIDETYTPYLIDVEELPGASIDAAVAKAAHDTLVAIYPKQATKFDAALSVDLAKVVRGAAEGIAVGATVAQTILAARANDGSNVANVYTPGTGPLDWKPDPLHPNQKALTPDWGFVKPFTMNSGSQFRPAPPPDANSSEYAAAFDEVRRLGGDGVTTPTERTADQTEAGIFWGYDGQPGLCTPPRLYNQIVQQIARERGNTLVQNARLFALVNLAQADAGVSAWEAKYFYNFARPVTAIREAANDGNSNTVGDPNWSPLGAPADNGNGTNFTPPFPAYTSGHATFGGAIFEVLRKFYGTDSIAFTFLSDEFNGQTFGQMGQVRPIKPRTFTTLSQAEEENGQSRIYLGIHWSFDKSAGIEAGNQIADNVFDKFLRTRPETTRFVVGADVGGAPRVRVFQPGGTVVLDFFAFDPKFTGGVRVALGDVNDDGVPDIIAATGPGVRTAVKVFDGTTLAVLNEYAPFDGAFTGGSYVASGDVDGDGFADTLISAAETGGPRVQIYSGRTQSVLADFFAFDADTRSGARIAAADLNEDGRADMITAMGIGGLPSVRNFSGATGALMNEFQVYSADFRGGVYVAAGDCDGDGRADIVAGAGAGGGPHVEVFNSRGEAMQSYFAFSPSTKLTKNGVRVGCVDVNGDGRADLITGSGTGDEPVLECRSANDLTSIERFYAFESGFSGGVNV